jgi:hypothetical protein
MPVGAAQAAVLFTDNLKPYTQSGSAGDPKKLKRLLGFTSHAGSVLGDGSSIA